MENNSTRMEQKHMKALKLEVKTDGVSIETNSSSNDIMMVSLIGVIFLSALGIWLKHRNNK